MKREKITITLEPYEEPPEPPSPRPCAACGEPIPGWQAQYSKLLCIACDTQTPTRYMHAIFKGFLWELEDERRLLNEARSVLWHLEKEIARTKTIA